MPETFGDALMLYVWGALVFISGMSILEWIGNLIEYRFHVSVKVIRFIGDRVHRRWL